MLAILTTLILFSTLAFATVHSPYERSQSIPPVSLGYKPSFFPDEGTTRLMTRGDMKNYSKGPILTRLVEALSSDPELYILFKADELRSIVNDLCDTLYKREFPSPSCALI